MLKRIPNRFFWDWDHSTTWVLNVPGSQNSGVANGYAKEPEIFEEDFRRMTDWCAAHKMQAAGVVGLLRDRHGGVEAARRVCGYAREKGVRIYLITGLYAYGGIYHEGEDAHSLENFLRKNPHCRARNADGSVFTVPYKGRWGTKVDAQGCPSQKEMRDFVVESMDWVFRTIPELGGVQMESCDSGLCQCPACRERRGDKYLEPWVSIADMAGIYPAAVEAVYRNNPDALVICETYHHFLDPECGYMSDPTCENAKALLNMPKSVTWQWKCDKQLRDGSWTENDSLPESMRGFHHVMRSHCGTQWWGTRDALDLERIRRQCRLSAAAGIDGVSMFGESSPFNTGAEMNYLALEYFADDPTASTEAFQKDVMAPLLGGENAAALYTELSRRCERGERLTAGAEEICRLLPKLDTSDARRRWLWLANRLNSFAWESEKSGAAASDAFHG